MGMDMDYVFGDEVLKELKELFFDQPHGERGEMAEDIIDFSEKMHKKYGKTREVLASILDKPGYNKFKIGENVRITQNTQTILGLPHQDGYVVYDILKLDVKFPIVLKHEEMGKDWVEFFDENELTIEE